MYGKIPLVETVLEIYKEYKSEENNAYNIELLTSLGCHDEAEAPEWYWDNAEKIDDDSCLTDIDIILEEEGYVYIRNDIQVVNGSIINLFNKENMGI